MHRGCRKNGVMESVIGVMKDTADRLRELKVNGAERDVRDELLADVEVVLAAMMLAKKVWDSNTGDTRVAPTSPVRCECESANDHARADQDGVVPV